MNLISIVFYSFYLPFVFGIPYTIDECLRSDNCYHNAIGKTIQDQGDFSEVLKGCRDGEDFTACRLKDVTAEKLITEQYVTFYTEAIKTLEVLTSNGDVECSVFYTIANLINGDSSETPTWFRNMAVSYGDSLKRAYGTIKLCDVKSAPVLEKMKREKEIKENYLNILPSVINKIEYVEALKSCRGGDDLNSCRLIDVTDEKLITEQYVTFYTEAIKTLEVLTSNGDVECSVFYTIANLINGDSSETPTWFRNMAVSYGDSLKRAYGTIKLCDVKSAPVLEKMKREKENKENYLNILLSVINKTQYVEVLSICRDNDDLKACRLNNVTDDKLIAEQYVTFYTEAIKTLEVLTSNGDVECSVFYTIANLINGDSSETPTWFRNMAVSYGDSLKRAYGTIKLCDVKSAPVLEKMKREKEIKENCVNILPPLIDKIK